MARRHRTLLISSGRKKISISLICVVTGIVELQYFNEKVIQILYKIILDLRENMFSY